jgi:site-specific recombinase XerD
VLFKKTAKTAIGYLEKAEIGALLNQPDRRTSLGVRDHALLLFLYNSGARADEAAKLTVGNLQLGASAICSGNSSGACRLPCGRTIRPATRYLSITPARKS